MTNTEGEFAGPLIAAQLAHVLMVFTDTLMMGKLGPAELAAVSFTFPVCALLMNVSMGLGIGTAIHISSRIGKGDLTEARRTAAHAAERTGDQFRQRRHGPLLQRCAGGAASDDTGNRLNDDRHKGFHKLSLQIRGVISAACMV